MQSAAHPAPSVTTEPAAHEPLEGEPTAAPLRPLPPALAGRAGLAVHRAIRGVIGAVLPELTVLGMASGMGNTMLLGAVARLGVADLLEREPMTAVSLAHRTGSDPDALHRALRALASRGVFRLMDDGRFANNRLSRVLLSKSPSRVREFCRYFASESNVRAWASMDRVIATGESGFVLGNGASIWDWFAAHPEEEASFAHAMMGMTTLEAGSIAKAYPFGDYEIVCDVGGGRGTLLSEILVRNPALRGILCDAPGVLRTARSLLTRRGVADRVTLAPGSFFDRVPEGADVYVLKHILHDWDDERSLAILKVVRRAAKPGARLVVVDAVLERNDTKSLAAVVDVQMMIVLDRGRERSAAEMAELLRDAGFRSERVTKTPSYGVHVAVAVD